MTAWLNGFIGIALTVAIGTLALGLSLSDVAICIASSLISGLIALMVTLKAEHGPWIRKNILNRQLWTWTFFSILYFSVMPLLAPPLKDLRVYGVLVVPLILCTGITILAFGPIQDALVARKQRRVKASAVQKLMVKQSDHGNGTGI